LRFGQRHALDAEVRAGDGAVVGEREVVAGRLRCSLDIQPQTEARSTLVGRLRREAGR
jgi:hypothetical protein